MSRRSAIWSVVVLLVLALLAVIGLTAVHALEVRRHLVAAEDGLRQVFAAAKSGQGAQSDQDLQVAQREVADAHRIVNGWDFSISSHIPLIGPNAVALQAATNAVSDVLAASDPLAKTVLQRDGLKQVFSKGRVDLAKLHALTASVDKLHTVTTTAAKQVHSLNADALLPPLASPLETLAARLDDLREQSQQAARGMTVAASLFGTRGPRNILMVFQNPAEARGSGGIIGAWALLSSNDGQLKLTSFGTNEDIKNVQPLPEWLDDGTRQTYGADLAISANFSLTPSFPTVARLFRDGWVKPHADGSTPTVVPDAVMSADPVAISEMMAKEPDLQLSDGQRIAPADLPDYMLRRVYAEYGDNSTARVPLMADVTQAVFTRLTTGSIDPTSFVSGVAKGVSERRVMFWSERKDEESLFTHLSMDGALPQVKAHDVYWVFNNADASKLNYYLTPRPECDGTLHLTSSAPAHLPDYASNHVKGLTNRSTMRLNVYAYLPRGANVRGVTVNGQVLPFQVTSDGGWRVLAMRFALDPKQTATLVLKTDDSLESHILQPFSRHVDAPSCR